ncbi:MAG: hypothetical protein ACK6EB_44315, partial [Planctomyces sp.]
KPPNSGKITPNHAELLHRQPLADVRPQSAPNCRIRSGNRKFHHISPKTQLLTHLLLTSQNTHHAIFSSHNKYHVQHFNRSRPW